MSIKAMHNSAPRSFDSFDVAYEYLVGIYGKLPDHYHGSVVELARTLANVWRCEKSAERLEVDEKGWKEVQDALRGHAKYAQGLTAELNNALSGGDRRIGVKEKAAAVAEAGAPGSALTGVEGRLRKLREGAGGEEE